MNITVNISTHSDFIIISLISDMRSGPFALMHTDVNDDPRYMFLRLFLVNIADEVCTRKFLC